MTAPLAGHLLRRLASSIGILFLVTVLTFVLVHAAAGTYVPGLAVNPDLRPEDVVRMRHELGLDQPLPVQYWQWFTAAAHGDLGRSLIDGTSVTQEILERLPNSLELTVTALLLALVLAVPLGVLGALRRGGPIDQVLALMSVAGVSIPAFWLGLIMILVFSVLLHELNLPSLPSSGASDPLGSGGLPDRIAHLVMPATVLSFGYLVVWSRFLRSSMLEVLAQDYIRTALAKGATVRRAVYVHGLRNALIPLVTLLGLELPGLVGGGAIVEIVFAWPGIGRLALERALQYDYTVVMGITTMAAVLVIAGNLLADLIYTALDPRIRLG